MEMIYDYISIYKYCSVKVFWLSSLESNKNKPQMLPISMMRTSVCSKYPVWKVIGLVSSLHECNVLRQRLSLKGSDMREKTNDKLTSITSSRKNKSMCEHINSKKKSWVWKSNLFISYHFLNSILNSKLYLLFDSSHIPLSWKNLDSLKF